MSKTLEFIIAHNFGYRFSEYEYNEKILLNDVLNFELIDLGNIDIPYYLSENGFIDLSIYDVTDEEYQSMKDESYLKWLNVNKFSDTPDSLKMFRADCNMQKYQCYSKYILKDIKINIEEALDCNINNIIAIWLNSQFKNDNIIYVIPKQYIILSDMDELGVLVAYNNSL